MNRIQESINGYSVYFRVITPILVTIMIFMITQISNNLNAIDKHFTNHLEHHQDLEVGYERRITKLEENRIDINRRIIVCEDNNAD